MIANQMGQEGQEMEESDNMMYGPEDDVDIDAMIDAIH